MTTTWGPIVYPVALDSFAPALIDNVDEVIANHPNSLASAIRALETKLGITNAPVTGLGGVSFDPAGKAANPGAPGAPTIWADNSGGPGFNLYYTDDLGSTYDLQAGGVTIRDWSPGTVYTVDQEVMYVGLRFRCIAFHTSGGTFFNDTDLSKWTCISGEGIIVNQVAHGFSELDVVYSNAGVWTAAQANAVGTLSVPPMLVIGVGTAVNYFLAAQDQIVTVSLHGLVVDDIYYLSAAAAGTLTNTEPTGAGNYSLPICRVLSANTLAILPNRPILAPALATPTLDLAYDGGGSGAGRAITADSGAVTITVPDTSNNAGLEITQNDVTNDPVAMTITNAGDGSTLTISNAGSGAAITLAGVGGRFITSDSANLGITTTTSGDIDINSIGDVDVDGVNVQLDATSAISLGAAAASDFTVDSANLTLQTTTSGAVFVTSAGDITANAAGGSLYLQSNSGFGGDLVSMFSTNNVEIAATDDLLMYGGTGVLISPYADQTGTFFAVSDGGGTAGLNGAAGTDIWASFEGRIEQSGTAGYTVVDIDTNEVSNGSGTRKLLNVAYEGTPQVWITYDGVTHVTDKITGDAADLTLEGRSASITLNEVGQTALNGGFAATSLIGAINELYVAVTAVTLDTAYDGNAGGGAGRAITADSGAVTITVPDTSNNLALEITQNDSTNNPNAVSITNAGSGAALVLAGAGSRLITSDSASLTISTTSSGDIDINSVAVVDIDGTTIEIDASGGVSIDAVAASNFTVSGASADLTLGARGATTTLNEAGQATLSGSFTATSIIGALNELIASVGVAGGSPGEIQWNNAGAFDGTSVMNYDSANTMIFVGDVTSRPAWSSTSWDFWITKDGGSCGWKVSSANTSVSPAAYVQLIAMRDTHASPDPLQSGDTIGAITYSGCHTADTDASNGVQLVVDTTEAWSAVAQGCSFDIRTITNTTTTLAVRYEVGGTGHHTFYGAGAVPSQLFEIDATYEFLVAPSRSGEPAIESGAFFYDTSANLWKFGENGAWVTFASGGGGVSLDIAYNNGNTIDVDGSPVTLTVSDTDNNAALSIVQNDVTNNPVAMTITNAGTGSDIELVSGGTIGTTANGSLTLLPNGSGITIIGDAGSTSRTLNTNDDLFVAGRVEVDGILYADSDIEQQLTNFHYWGDPSTNGSFRIGPNSSDQSTFVIEMRCSGTWTTIHEFEIVCPPPA